MDKETYFPTMIGQNKVLEVATFFINSFKETSVFPHTIILGKKGQGKTQLAHGIARNLRPPEGTMGKPKPMVELNCATLKNLTQLIDIYDSVIGNNHITLFFDEVHDMPKKLQNAFLTILNPNSLNRTHLAFEDRNIEWDFHKVSFIFATTDPQGLIGPFKDRCEIIQLEDYSYEDVAEIVRLNSIGNKYEVTYDSDQTLHEIATVCRGNARNAVMMAQNKIMQYAQSKGIKKFTSKDWNDLKALLGIYPLGLMEIEVSIMKVLADGNLHSLKSVAARTGQTDQSIRQEYETYLMQHGFIEIESGGRKITKKGRDFMKELEKAGVRK